MKKLLSLTKKAVLAAGVVSAVANASADTVNYDYTGETGGGVGIGIHTSDFNGTALVGQFIMTTANPSYQSTLLTYCTDVGEMLQNSYNYTPTPLSSATGAAPIWISGGIQNASTLWYNDKAGATTAIQTAGLQLAIWELLYNNLSSYSSANFYSHGNNGFYLTSTDANTTAAVNDAVSLLSSLNSLPGEQNVEWLAPTEENGSIGGSQGLLYQVPGTTSIPPVPEAASTVALFGAAIVLLGAVKFTISKA
jgi:hypothetical protein